MECSFWQRYYKEEDRCVANDLTWFVIWTIVNCIPVWYMLYKNKNLKPQPDEPEQYKPFQCTQYKYWNYFTPLLTHTFFLPRLLVGWSLFWTGYAIVIFFAPCNNNGNPYPEYQKKIGHWYAPICSRLATVPGGFIPWRYRVECDYSYWLGPDYEYTYEGAGIWISNHQSLFDVVWHQNLHQPFCSFLGKEESTKFPGIKALCGYLEQILVPRDRKMSPEAGQKFVDQITERQILAEQGKKPPITIYPEGATTNGNYVMQFRRGAFDSLRAVKPHVTKIYSLTGINATCGAVGAGAFLTICMCQFNLVNCSEMPVFKPNDYFWKHHWDGKEEKWKLYARVVQKICADELGVPTSNSSIKEKLEYRQMKRSRGKITIKSQQGSDQNQKQD